MSCVAHRPPPESSQTPPCPSNIRLISVGRSSRRCRRCRCRGAGSMPLVLPSSSLIPTFLDLLAVRRCTNSKFSLARGHTRTSAPEFRVVGDKMARLGSNVALLVVGLTALKSDRVAIGHVIKCLRCKPRDRRFLAMSFLRAFLLLTAGVSHFRKQPQAS